MAKTKGAISQREINEQISISSGTIQIKCVSSCILAKIEKGQQFEYNMPDGERLSGGIKDNVKEYVEVQDSLIFTLSINEFQVTLTPDDINLLIRTLGKSVQLTHIPVY